MTDPLREALAPLFESLVATGPGKLCRLPPFEHGDPERARLLVRALYAWAVDERADGAHPLRGRVVELAGKLSSDDLIHAAMNSQGGLVVLYDLPKRLRLDTSVWWVHVDASLQPWTVDEPTRLRLETLSRTWIMANPIWRAVRRDLVRYAAEGKGILLTGVPGGGKRSLVEAAHAMAGGSGELLHVQRGGIEEIRDLPADWVLVEDGDELQPEAMEFVRESFEKREPSLKRLPGVRTGVRPTHPELEDLIGEDPRWCAALNQIVALANTAETVLICGETGTGKTMLARKLHALGRGATGGFVHVNMSRPELLQVELFGTLKGSYTGAADSPGALERASGGTLFLDEVDAASREGLKTLKNVLDNAAQRDGDHSFEVTRLGGRQAVTTSARIVLASNEPLAKLVAENLFQQDLYQRIAQRTIFLPPLRERPGDIKLIAAKVFEKHGTVASDETMEVLCRAPWPGNHRELQSVLTAAVEAAKGSSGPVAPRHLPRELRRAAGPPGPVIITLGSPNGPLPPIAKQYQRARLVPLPVPEMPRDADAVGSIILMLLDGRPISPPSLNDLAQRCFWALSDLVRQLRRVLADPEVRGDEISRRLGPEPKGAGDPIVVLRGELPGEPEEDPGIRLNANAVVIGRLKNRSDYDAYEKENPDVGPWLEQRVRDRVLAFVALDLSNQSSRLQVLVRRSPNGLWVEAPPGREVTVEPLDLQGPEQSASTRVEVSRGARLRLRSAGGMVLTLYLFASPHDREALHRRIQQGPLSTAHRTEPAGGSLVPTRSAVPRPAPKPGDYRGLKLNDEETLALGDCLLTFGGGSFAAHVERWACEHTTSRGLLEARLKNVGRGLPDDVGNLLRQNPDAARAIREMFRRLSDGEERIGALPTKIRGVLAGG